MLLNENQLNQCQSATPLDILNGPKHSTLHDLHLAVPRNLFHGKRKKDHGYRGGFNEANLDKNMQLDQ